VSVAQKSNSVKKQQSREYEWHVSMGWYHVCRALARVLFHTLWPLKSSGAQYVPRTGSGVIVSNHLSLIDPFVIGYAANRDVSFMGKEELFQIPIIGFVVRKLGAFPVDRSRRDPASMRIALTVLKEGELLGMFPEGHRSTTGDMIAFHTGAARLAARTRSPIIPAAVVNTNNAMPPGKIFRPARIGVRFGPPFELTELYENPKDEATLERALTTLRERIAALQGGAASC
jgi:1-acyl-sn-glycerol-3-phosphate acyltransferase